MSDGELPIGAGVGKRLPLAGASSQLAPPRAVQALVVEGVEELVRAVRAA
jgi:hypothetical protein